MSFSSHIVLWMQPLLFSSLAAFIKNNSGSCCFFPWSMGCCKPKGNFLLKEGESRQDTAVSISTPELQPCRPCRLAFSSLHGEQQIVL